ncbi:ASHH4 [Symbiodinium pilosum]|uniref:ASHH4 protein n=1 Tax=Symbiodinium pilosum TaxID=2952 RepID=A0A812Y938_SYMPI|nr:ASHH4 [Symbiodinium pilosum]
MAQAIEELLKDPNELSEEGLSWSKEVGMAFVLPRAALQCVPLAANEPRDGLQRTASFVSMPKASPKLIVAPAGPCGFGVFATERIASGERLGEYTGEIRSYDVWCEEIKALKMRRRNSDASSPFIREELYAAWAGSGPAEKGVVIDAFHKGNLMRFINCSCKPNCSFKSVSAPREAHGRLQVTTLRAIAAGEQLSVDYGWYHDPATLEDIRKEAVVAYLLDLPKLQALRLPDPVANEADSEAVQLVAESLKEARGRPGLRRRPHGFLAGLLDSEALARFLESGKHFSEATTYRTIPEPVWLLYEVLGGERVGIPCRCGSDASLNSSGRCSGIIGRPLQVNFTGRDSDDER